MMKVSCTDFGLAPTISSPNRFRARCYWRASKRFYGDLERTTVLYKNCAMVAFVSIWAIAMSGSEQDDSL